MCGLLQQHCAMDTAPSSPVDIFQSVIADLFALVDDQMNAIAFFKQQYDDALEKLKDLNDSLTTKLEEFKKK